ncbi:hypothetical protein BDZ91DRAFT_758116 [Kalaharituber pfeilii]|nr:hypothetical protein BDZ91DRAFT_758116 [Kalaharituber pfeilii]
MSAPMYLRWAMSKVGWSGGSWAGMRLVWGGKGPGKLMLEGLVTLGRSIKCQELPFTDLLHPNAVSYAVSYVAVGPSPAVPKVCLRPLTTTRMYFAICNRYLCSAFSSKILQLLAYFRPIFGLAPSFYGSLVDIRAAWHACKRTLSDE